jgi:hypothetical protein
LPRLFSHLYLWAVDFPILRFLRSLRVSKVLGFPITAIPGSLDGPLLTGWGVGRSRRFRRSERLPPFASQRNGPPNQYGEGQRAKLGAPGISHSTQTFWSGFSHAVPSALGRHEKGIRRNLLPLCRRPARSEAERAATITGHPRLRQRQAKAWATPASWHILIFRAHQVLERTQPSFALPGERRYDLAQEPSGRLLV